MQWASLAILAAGTVAVGDLPLAMDALPTETTAWRSARWGMTADEVVKAFPGEAKPLEKPIQLPDGNVVAAGIDEHTVASTKLQVRFVFGSGKLVLVTLRTPEKTYAAPEVYAALSKHLAAELGGPGEETKDDNFIDMRQTRWDVGRNRVDLKYIPGVVVILHSPREKAPPGEGAKPRPPQPGAEPDGRGPGPWAPAPRTSR